MLRTMSVEQKSSSKLHLHEGIWKIERYGVCETDGWSEDSTDESRIYLILKNLTLMVMSNDTVVDLIPLATNVRMVIKNDSLGIAVTHGDKQLRKIRLKFADTNSYSSILVARSCAATLKRYVQVEDLSCKAVFAPSSSSSDDKNLSVSLREHISQLMNQNLTELKAGEMDFSSMYPLEDMIEICILDQDFPSFVAEVHETLLKKLKRN